MILCKTLEMRVHRPRDLLRIFHSKEMPDDIGVVFRLTRKPQFGVFLLNDLSMTHHLNNCWVRIPTYPVSRSDDIRSVIPEHPVTFGSTPLRLVS